ncbi:MAG: hypothetical protein Q8O74_07065, partial [bacterium]|nr:hypothetical protein [bacterium]
FSYFGETGSYDRYNPSFVCGKAPIPEMAYLLASSQPFTLSRARLTGRLNIDADLVDNAINDLLRIGAIEESDYTYKLCFPVFLERDLLLIDKYLSSVGEMIGQNILSLKDILHHKIERLECRKIFTPERILYHLICDDILDGAAFDFFSIQGILCASKPQPDNRDYLMVGFEESEKVNKYSSGLLCSSNNFRSGGFNFNSFGDANGTRKDMYRFFRSVQKNFEKATPFDRLNLSYSRLLDRANGDVAKKCGELILSVASQRTNIDNLEEYDRDLINFLKEMEYLDIDKSDGDVKLNIPVFQKTDRAVINEISDLVLNRIHPQVRTLLENFETQVPGLTALKHKVDPKEIANELWHQIFGRTNEYLVQTGSVAMPKNIHGEGRYLRSLWICDD